MALYVEEGLKVACVPNKYCYALVMKVLRVNGYIEDAYHPHIEAGFQCKIDVHNTSGNLSASFCQQMCLLLNI